MADEQIVDDKPVTEDDLKALKYDNAEVETGQPADEPADVADETATDDQGTEGEDSEQIAGDAESEETSTDESEEPTFTKKFPQIKGDTPEEYARNLEQAYDNSTTEYHKLRESQVPVPADDDEELPVLNPTDLFVKQEMDKQISTAFDNFKKDYPQVTESADYDSFVKRVRVLSKTIMEDEQRLAPPDELYNAAAASLGWQRQTEPTDKERLGMALKDGAAASKTSSATKPASKSKVTPEMIAANRRMYPGKSDAQIREELEPYVQ